jgi:hypothetical protein
VYGPFKLEPYKPTNNLNIQELEEPYGNHVLSRMRQLFNLIAFDEKSSDKRI